PRFRRAHPHASVPARPRGRSGHRRGRVVTAGPGEGARRSDPYLRVSVRPLRRPGDRGGGTRRLPPPLADRAATRASRRPSALDPADRDQAVRLVEAVPCQGLVGGQMTKESPVVSVVMCAWKPRPDWFHEAVASVLADDGILELIIVDDGSPEPVEA